MSGLEPKSVALLQPDMPSADELRPWLERIDASGHYTNFGPLCRGLEGELAGLIPNLAGAHVATTSSGTLALELALAALGLAPGTRVALPSLTFAATASAVRRAGLEPVFCDVAPDTWGMEIEQSHDLEKHDIGAVVPVAIYGCPQDATLWDTFTADTGIPVVIDAAGAFGNQGIGRTTSAVFSMHATKAFAAGEGGFVASADPDFIRKTSTASNFGFDHDCGEQRGVDIIGTNAKLSEYHAAVALARLTRWPDDSRGRVALAQSYAEELGGIGGKVELQAGGEHWVRSVFVIRATGGISPATVERLGRRGVEARRWYWPPLHEHPAFAGCDRIGDLAVTRELSKQLLGIPFHPGLDGEDIARVCRALDEVLS